MSTLVTWNPLHSARRWLTRALPVVATALMVACGGGGGGGSSPLDAVQGPPETAATLASGTDNASQAVQAVVSAADAMAEQGSALSGLNGLFGGPVGLQRVVASAARVRPQAVTNLSCLDFLETLPCTGTVVVDTNVSDTATRLQRGDFVEVTFQNLTGSLLGERVEMNGSMRLDLLAAISLEPLSFRDSDMVITFTGFRGNVAGLPFGPVDQAGRLQVSAQGVLTLTADGQRFTGLGAVTPDGEDGFIIAGSSVRAAYWADAARYVDLNLTNWRVSGGRPAVNSAAAVAAGSGGIGIAVVGRGSSSVTYEATITLGGSSLRYRVTATYPAGGGAPSYSAVPI